MRVLIVPAAGLGRRFKEAGFAEPKPFIELPNGQFMLQRAVEPFLPYVKEVVVALPALPSTRVSDYSERYQRWADDIPINTHQLFYPTWGAAVTLLSFIGRIREDDEVIIANSDQFFEGHQPLDAWFDHIDRVGPEASVLTFKAEPGDRRWSYVAPYFAPNSEEHGQIAHIAEKDPISAVATCGVYYVARFGDLVTGISRMIAHNDRTNGEFYVAPALNYISGSKTWWNAPKNSFWSVGTPELLQHWMQHWINPRAQP